MYILGTLILIVVSLIVGILKKNTPIIFWYLLGLIVGGVGTLLMSVAFFKSLGVA